MKRHILLPSLLIAAAAFTAKADTAATSSTISMVEGLINVDMNLDLKAIPVKSNQVVVLTPYLVNQADTLYLPGVGVYGRNRYIQHLRGNDNGMAVPEVTFKASKAPADYRYHTMVPYADWIDGATLSIRTRTYGCASCPEGEVTETTDLSLWRAPRLDTSDCFAYTAPVVEGVKERAISGRANVEFPVNQTVLLPDFRGNYAELAVVRGSVDSVRNDADVTIKSMSIKGFASPEGPYKNNVRLAQGRTDALKAYVENLYAFPKGLIETSSEPEDWAGLRQWVAASNLENRDGILAIIDDTSLAPDPRDQEIRRRYPADYAFLLANVYPSLRHTDYRISYVVRSYSDPAEILAIMKKRPGNLSLDEFFVAAQSLEPGSPEFNEVFDIAVRMYPDNPVANLNAANTAMSRGDYAAAEGYLAKAGDSPEATHARGALALMQGDYDRAQQLLESSLAAGITRSRGLLDQIDALREYQSLRNR